MVLDRRLINRQRHDALELLVRPGCLVAQEEGQLLKLAGTLILVIGVSGGQRGVEELIQNLMAEIEIRDLHDKLDSLRFKQWHELWHIQKRQIELLEHLCARNADPDMKIPAPTPYVPPEL